MPCIGRYDLPHAYVGDTWDGVPQIQVEVNDDLPAASLAQVRLKVVNPITKAVLVHFTSVDPAPSGDTLGITISDAAAWKFVVNPISRITFAPGTYDFDLETTDAANVRKTYVTGKWVIRPEK